MRHFVAKAVFAQHIILKPLTTTSLNGGWVCEASRSFHYWQPAPRWRLPQGCALRKITRGPKFPNCEIQDAQCGAYMKKVSLSGCPKAKVSRLRHPGALRAQPCSASWLANPGTPARRKQVPITLKKVGRGRDVGEDCLEDELPYKNSIRIMYCRGESKNASIKITSNSDTCACVDTTDY